MSNHPSQDNKLLDSVRELLLAQSRAEYGKALLKELSKSLTAEFGKGFDTSNLRYMRLVY